MDLGTFQNELKDCFRSQQEITFMKDTTVVTVRPEAPGDLDAIRSVNEKAFGRPGEADLVAALRAGADPTISLVAEMGGEIVGHIFFSPVVIESPESTFTATAL